MIKNEVLEKIREVGAKNINRDLKNDLQLAGDDLGIELAIDYHAGQIEKLEKFISALENARTFEELQDVLFIYDYIMDDVNNILNNI